MLHVHQETPGNITAVNIETPNFLFSHNNFFQTQKGVLSQILAPNRGTGMPT